MKQPFRRFGVMLDMSRNSVMNVPALKDYTSLLAEMGYNTLMLYTEDTYEIPEEPYFGHFRGRYSQAELKEIVHHCAKKGIEVIPCIQTLAHLDGIFRHRRFLPLRDTDNILLAEEEETYRLIERMFQSARACFTTDVCHIGMDEAHMVGLGQYLDRHGFENRFQILSRHLKKVCEIAEKYGFRPLIWGDMFFRLANHGRYYNVDEPVVPTPEELNLPEEVQIVQWDYYYTTYEHYEKMIRAHRKLERPLWFAGGVWTWTGFSPDNRFSLRHAKAALAACRDAEIENVIFTMWGDNGGECSRLSVLPSLYAIARMAQEENVSEEVIQRDFETRFGIAFDDFCLLDLKKPRTAEDSSAVVNPERYLLYNDPFLGVFDSALEGDEASFYGNLAEKLKPLTENESFGLLFQSALMLASTLQWKADLGVRCRALYQSGDPAACAALLRDFDLCLNHLKGFLEDMRALWLWENKPFGLEVHELRLGGLITRMEFCRRRWAAWLETGEGIPELEEKNLDYAGQGETFCHQPLRHAKWAQNATFNLL